MVKLSFAFALFGFVRLFGFFTEPRLTEAEIHRVMGEPVRIVAPAVPTNELRLVTWNIERGQEYEGVLAVLRELDADVLLLQEVDRGCRRTNYRDVARDLAHALGMNWVSAGEFQEIGEGRDGQAGITGQAVLSRFAIDDVEVLRFRAQDRLRWAFNPVQPRRGGRMALKARTAGLVVYNTHIESGGNDGLGQRQIAEIVDDYSRNPLAAQSVVIGGDFNNGPVDRAPMFSTLNAAEFQDALGPDGDRGPTSFGQRHPIDWIFVKNATTTRGRIVQATASDHLPLMTSLETSSSVAAR